MQTIDEAVKNGKRMKACIEKKDVNGWRLGMLATCLTPQYRFGLSSFGSRGGVAADEP